MADVKCYELHFDCEDDQYGSFIDCLTDVGDVARMHDVLYVWLDYDKSKTELKQVFSKLNISEYYCKPVAFSDVEGRHDFLEAWYIEHNRVFLIKKYEQENQ